MNNQNNISRRNFVAKTGTAMAALPVFPLLKDVQPSENSLRRALNYKDELLHLLKQLIKVPSLEGESAADAQQVVKDYLSKLPYTIEESADRPSLYQDHPEYMTPNPSGDGPFVNVVGWPKKGKATQFALFSHIDTHSIEEGWRTDPYEPTLVGSRLYGLGTSDDKGGVAAMLIAAKIMGDTRKALPVIMSLHGKGGGGRGSLPVFERIRKKDHGIAAVLYVHPAETGRGLEDIKNSVQGIADLQLSMTGWRGEPLEIGSIDSAEWTKGGSALDRSLELLELLRETVFKDILVNVGILSGGDRIGSIADQATITLRLKFTGKHTFTVLVNEAKSVINEFITSKSTAQNTYKAELKSVGYMTNPGAADWEVPESKVLRSSIANITGQAPTAYPNHYAGDIRYPIRLLDVPCLRHWLLGR